MTFNERQKFPPINLSNELSKVPVDVETVIVTIGSLGRSPAKRLFWVINYSAMKSKWPKFVFEKLVSFARLAKLKGQP